MAGFAFFSIISGLAEVGSDTITETLSDARWGLVIIALVLTQTTNLTDAISAAAVAPKKIPVGVTTVEQFSISFIDLATPGNTGQMATNARFFGKFGMKPVTAMTVGAITGIISILAQAQRAVQTASIEQGLAFVGEAAQLIPEILDRVDADGVADAYFERIGFPPEATRSVAGNLRLKIMIA